MAPNCGNYPCGFPSLVNLVGQQWKGEYGGLYPNGNERPGGYEKLGRDAARSVVPRNSQGTHDEVNGKIVLLILGTSATTFIAIKFLARVAAEAGRLHRKLVVVDAAQVGKTIDEVAESDDSYWTTFVPGKLAAAGVTENQVAAAWFQSGERDPQGVFPQHVLTTKGYWAQAIDVARSLFPYLGLMWLTPALFQGYANPPLAVPEPAYGEQGYALKWLVEDRVMSGLAASVTPLLSIHYAWADGAVTNADGLSWVCPTHVQSDGRHPSVAGATLLADRLFEELVNDWWARSWFLRDIPQTGTTPIPQTGPKRVVGG